MGKTYRNISVDIKEPVAIFRINRPEQHNSRNREMMDEIITIIVNVNERKDVQVFEITGNGRAFMTRADIKEYADHTPEGFLDFQEKGTELCRNIENTTKPWLPAVNGFALSGRFELALICDAILANESYKIGLQEIFLSLVLVRGGTQQLIHKIVINRTKELLFTERKSTSFTLKDWGIVNYAYEYPILN